MGRLLSYTIVVVLFLVFSLLELAPAVTIMPITLLLRVFGVSTWPAEIGRAGARLATRHAGDFAAAGALRAGLSADIPARRPSCRSAAVAR
ncbi:MAG: hypothetical protein ABW137_19070 [Mycobacterium sp.]